MNINFYNFSKKENSTATPNGDGTVIACTMKTPASLQAPIVELTSATPPMYNYAHITDLGRYYFVTGVTYNRGIWEVALRVDVLASFKTDIGSTSMYFERSSAQQNGDLIDTLYPVTDDYSTSTVTIASSSGMAWSSGSFVLIVIDGDSNTGNTAYQFSSTEFGKFLHSIMDTGTDSYESVWDAITQSIKVTNYEPLKYIGACFWFPIGFSPGPYVATTSIRLGNFTASGFSCYVVDDTAFGSTLSYTVTLPKHPQAATRGKFCNLEPFSDYCVNLWSFGNIKLDSSALADATSISINIARDPNTGKARCIAKTNTGALVINAATQWGVPLSLSSGSYINMNGLSQNIAGAVGMGAGIATGNANLLMGGLSNYVSGILEAKAGSYSTIGSTGAMIDYKNDMELIARFFTLANDDNANNGRPYCAISTPATLTGYMIAEKGLVASTAATRPELDAVNTYMEEGFYYE